MRPWLPWFALVILACGCGGSDGPLAPTGGPGVSTAAVNPPAPDSRNWSPWTFPDWRPGIGEILVPGTTVSSAVVAGDICVANLRFVWDRRASCKRFQVVAPVQGRLDAFLRWDPSAPGFDPALIGDVVLIAPNGRFNSSPSLQVDEHTWALVDPGPYGVLVMSYVETNLPFQIRTELVPH
jgi:hypothetical protein